MSETVNVLDVLVHAIGRCQTKAEAAACCEAFHAVSALIEAVEAGDEYFVLAALARVRGEA